jgi:hypothetical protein
LATAGSKNDSSSALSADGAGLRVPNKKSPLVSNAEKLNLKIYGKNKKNMLTPAH